MQSQISYSLYLQRKYYVLFFKIHNNRQIGTMFPSQNIEELKKDIRDNKAMALFLGAGTDFSSEYPEGHEFDGLRGKTLSWKYLLEELTEAACINNEEKDTLNNLANAPLKAAILKNRLGDSYIPIIRNWLYTRCNRRILIKSYDKFKQYKDNPTVENLKKVPFGSLFSIADFILRQTSIRAVITQNYNNFLSEAIKILLDKRGMSYGETRRKMIPLDVYAGWKDEPYNENCFFIYHVHGYIPPPSEMLPSKESNYIVLSDEEFYQLSRDVYSWQNATQLHFLTHHTCIIIGLSLDDMTTARLLRHAKLENNSERVYWLRGGYNDGEGDALSRLKSDYFESQHLCIVNDAEGYQDLYHQILEELTANEK